MYFPRPWVRSFVFNVYTVYEFVFFFVCRFSVFSSVSFHDRHTLVKCVWYFVVFHWKGITCLVNCNDGGNSRLFFVVVVILFSFFVLYWKLTKITKHQNRTTGFGVAVQPCGYWQFDIYRFIEFQMPEFSVFFLLLLFLVYAEWPDLLAFNDWQTSIFQLNIDYYGMKFSLKKINSNKCCVHGVVYAMFHVLFWKIEQKIQFSFWLLDGGFSLVL